MKLMGSYFATLVWLGLYIAGFHLNSAQDTEFGG